MGKKRVDQYNQASNLHGVSDHHHHQEESQLLHKLNTHFKKLSKTRYRISPSSLDHHRVPTATILSSRSEKDAAPISAASIAMHACYGSPSSSSSAWVFDCNDDYYDHHGHTHAVVNDAAAAVALKLGQLDYCCSGESDTGTTTSFAVATENSELFGGENAVAPDLSAGHNLLHVGFVEDKNGFRIGLGRGSYLNDPISYTDGNAKYSFDMLELSSQEDMIQEFLKENLF